MQTSQTSQAGEGVNDTDIPIYTPSELAELSPDPDPKETDIATLVQLHPNLLAQLDTAFRRHHWLAADSGVGELLDHHCRSSTRGRHKELLNGTIYCALQMTAVFATGQATVQQMYVVACSLPLNTRREFNLAVYGKAGKEKEITRKQLHNMTSGLKRNLSHTECLSKTEKKALSEEEQATLVQARSAERKRAVAEIVTRLLVATHLIDTKHGTYAIDDTAIWAWSKAPKERTYRPGGADRPLADEDLHPPTGVPTIEVGEDLTDTDAPSTLETDADSPQKQDPSPWLCPDAQWGGKTSKGGNQVGVYGYKAHVIVNTNDPARQHDLPILIQALELTPANEDIVDVSLRLIDEIRARAPFERIIGDRHYGYKMLNRWALELWKRRIHQVLDLRADKPGAVDLYGSTIIDGRPRCPGMAAHLERLEPSDDPREQERFHQQIDYRHHFAFRMVKGPLASPSATDSTKDPKVGITRWQCPALDRRVGCQLRPATFGEARKAGLPLVPNPLLPRTQQASSPRAVVRTPSRSALVSP